MSNFRDCPWSGCPARVRRRWTGEGTTRRALTPTRRPLLTSPLHAPLSLGPPTTASTSGRLAPAGAGRAPPAASASTSGSDDAAFHDVELGAAATAAPGNDGGGGPPVAGRRPPPPGDATTTTAATADAKADDNDPAKPPPLSPSASGTYPECRICLEAGTTADLVAPCACIGSVRCAHLKCLQTWVEERRGLMTCEICGAPYTPAVTPLLADAAARGAARMAAAAVAAAAGGPGGRPHGVDGVAAAATATGCLGSPRSRAWVAAAAVFAVALALLYVVLFVGGDHQPSFWAVLLLRILSFVLPMYLIVQACLSFRRYRQMRIAAGM